MKGTVQLWQRGKIWCAHFWQWDAQTGRWTRIRRSLNTSDRKTARLRPVQMQRKLLEGEMGMPKEVAIQDLLNEYKPYLKARRTTKSCQVEMNYLDAFLLKEKIQELSDITPRLFEDHLTRRRNVDGISQATANRIRSSLSSMFRFAITRGYANDNVALNRRGRRGLEGVISKGSGLSLDSAEKPPLFCCK